MFDVETYVKVDEVVCSEFPENEMLPNESGEFNGVQIFFLPKIRYF